MSNICEGYETAKKRAEDRCLWCVSVMGVIDLLLQQNTRRRSHPAKCQTVRNSKGRYRQDDETNRICERMIIHKQQIGTDCNKCHGILSTYRIHFKVDQFSAGQCYHHLTHVHCTPFYCLLAWSFPLIHTLVRADMSNAIWINLQSHPQNILINTLGTKDNNISLPKHSPSLGQRRVIWSFLDAAVILGPNWVC